MRQRLCGIYFIENIVNNKVYVGQSVNIDGRFLKHKSSLKNNIHRNSHLQSAYNFYGTEKFVYNILLLCSKEKLTENEQIAKDYFEKTVGVYNKGECVDNPWFGQKHTSLSIMKQKNIKRPKMKPVERIDMNTGEVKEYESLSAVKNDGFSWTNVSAVCRGKILTHKNFYWQFLNGKHQKIDISKKYSKKCKPVFSKDLKTNEIKIYMGGAAQAARELGLSDETGINHCLRKKVKTSQGKVWNYLNNNEENVNAC